MVLVILVAATLLIAYANGANDNFKGVATLFGSGASGYKRALSWATFTTFLGSLTAMVIATKLIKTFSGKGLVPDSVVADPTFIAAVIVGAGLTVFFAARWGIPISTTHSLTGALVGAGWMAIGSSLHFGALGRNFFLPLLVSPLLAVVFTSLLYGFFHFLRKRFSLSKETCVCVGKKMIPVGHLGVGQGQVLTANQVQMLDVIIDEKEVCQSKAIQAYSGALFGIDLQRVADRVHFLSAGAVSFARGLNDTPKIVALLLAASIFDLKVGIVLVAIAMALGGWWGAKRIAETMSHRITPIHPGQGLTANVVTASMVIFASQLGMPVSTTHVSCGSIFGIGMIGKQARWRVMGGILSAWVLTLPVAVILAAVSYGTLRAMGLQ